MRGYRKAMQEAGAELRWADGRYRIDGGERAAEELLWEDHPTALIVAGNLMTIGVMRALRRRRLRVPRDVTLVAIDDPFWAELMDPPLTTLAQPVRRMAESAVEFLFERISSRRTEARKIVFDFELRVRGSCGTAGMNYEGGS